MTKKSSEMIYIEIQKRSKKIYNIKIKTGKIMASKESTGPQQGLTPESFMGLMAPIHLPTLISTNGEASPHLPKNHHVAALKISSLNDCLPMRLGYDLGSTEEFSYLSNDNEILTKCTLCVELAGLVPGDGGKNPRYADDVLCQAIEKVEWCYGSNTALQKIEPEKMHFEMLQEMDPQELERRRSMQSAGLSVKERVELAKDKQMVYLEIPFYWSKSADVNWHAHVLRRPLRVRITWRTPHYVLQQEDSGTLPKPKDGSVYIVQKWIRFHTVIPTPSTKEIYHGRINAKGDSGWLHLFSDSQFQEFNLAKGATFHNLKTDFFTKYGYNIRFILRPYDNLQPNVLNNRRFELLDIKNFQFDVSNKTFYPKTDDYYAKHVYNARNFLGNFEIPIYNVPFTDYPDLHTEGMGGLEFANVSNPQLKVETVPLPSNTILTAWLYCHNYIRIVIQGERSAIETVQPTF